MPLSEHEQRQLEQIEQALYREDRRLARLVRSSDPRVHYRRRVVYAALGLAVGVGLVVAGLVLPHLYYLAIAGFVVILLSGIWILASWRHAAGSTTPGAPAGPTGRRGARAARKKGPQGGSRRAAIMETFEERWRRRQERGGF